MTAYNTALVVGASRGIGLAITRSLLQDTNIKKVYASYRSAATAAGLSDIDDERLYPLVADVSDTASLAALGSEILDQGERPDLVIHCAGILHESGVSPEKSLRQVEPVALERMFKINSIGPLLLAKAVIPLMPRHRAAQFAVLSAMVGSICDNRLGGWYGYRGSKAALNQLMRTLAIECRRTHPQLCVTAIHPGTTDTELSKPFQGNVKPGKLYRPEQSAARILKVVTSGLPEESGRFVNWDGKPIPY